MPFSYSLLSNSAILIIIAVLAAAQLVRAIRKSPHKTG